MNRNFIPLIFVGLLVSGLFSCKSEQNLSSKKDIQVLETKINAETKFEYQIQETNETFAQASSKIDIIYPQIDGWANSTAQAKLNEAIRNYINRAEKAFIAEGGQPISANGETKIEKVAQEESSYFRPLEMALDINYKILTQTTDFLSLEINSYYYTGGAHGMPAFKIFNYDARLVKNLEMKDLFQEDADFLKIIAPYCKTELLKRMDEIGSDENTIEDGTDPVNPENYTLFEIKKEGLEVIFAPYQVAPYVAGAQSVLVPYETLKPILKENSILTVLQGN